MVIMRSSRNGSGVGIDACSASSLLFMDLDAVDDLVWSRSNRHVFGYAHPPWLELRLSCIAKSVQRSVLSQVYGKVMLAYRLRAIRVDVTRWRNKVVGDELASCGTNVVANFD